MSQPARELTFWDHLEVARIKLIRCVLYIAGATTIAWIFRQPLFSFLQYPALEAARRAHIDNFAFRIFDPAGGFVLLMQIALVAGVIVSAVAWIPEIILFITPGLYPHEKRALWWLLPFSLVLFVSGAAFCYVLSPAIFAFLFRLTQSLNVAVELNLVSYLYFLLRLILIFGLVFEMPLVVMMLVYFGFVSSQKLLSIWRWVIVLIAILAAAATPTPDWYTMTLLAAPMIVLYFLSIGLGRLVEKRRQRLEAEEAHRRAQQEKP